MRNAKGGALLRNTARATISSSQRPVHQLHSSKPIRNNLGGDMNSDLLDEYCQNLFGHTNWQMDGVDGNVVITFYAKPREEDTEESDD